MKAIDFTCHELRIAWEGYHSAIEYIESKPHYMQSEVFSKIIDKHRDKIACLERAQRIINAYIASQRLTT